jgi:hypothetical protein
LDIYLQQLPQQLVNGLTLGGVYALIAIGYTMVYGILGMLNFAHGEIYMIGGFTGWWVLHLLSRNNQVIMSAALVISLMIVLAMGVSGLVGLMTERFAYRPLRNAPRMNLLLSALGVSIFLQNLVLTYQGAKVRVFHIASLIPESIRVLHIGSTVFSFMRVLVIAVTFLSHGASDHIDQKNQGRQGHASHGPGYRSGSLYGNRRGQNCRCRFPDRFRPGRRCRRAGGSVVHPSGLLCRIPGGIERALRPQFWEASAVYRGLWSAVFCWA